MDTKDKILEAATALWTEKGYQQATMRELARRLGMGVSSLYFYFRSKEEIVQYLYVTLNQQALDQWKSVPHEGPGDSFQSFLSLKLQLLEPHRSCLAAIMREAVDPESSLNPMSADSSGVLQQNLEFFSDLAGGKGEQAVRLGRCLWLMHLGVILYWMHDKSAGAENTRLLTARLSDMMGMLPMMGRLPFMSSLLDLASRLFDTPAMATASVRAPEVDEALKEYDVVVVGGGPIGCVYASFLKQARPRTRILILEKAAEPGHKIGESTLSGFCKALRTLGISKEALQRLFFTKNGLGFLHIDEAIRDIRHAPEYILETFDQTYQVERRVLDTLLIANARRLGVEVIQGATVHLKQCRLGSPHNVVAYQIASRTYRIKASLLVDATGPAGLIARDHGLWTSEGTTFQTSSVWTYFTDVPPLASYSGWPGVAQFPRDEYTQHLCFRQGWMWYIPLVSWEGAPTANLHRAVDRLLRSGRSLPTRDQLAEDYGCPPSPLLSVGMAVRSDRDSDLKEDGGAAFQAYMKRYPVIRQVLGGGHQVADAYGSGQPFMQRLHFRGHARQVAGDGWLLVGDAAFFVDPLISPGLTGGTAQAFLAAQETVKALEAGTTTRDAFGAYEGFVHRLHEALERDNQLVYMSFNHPKAIALIQRFQEIDSRRHFLQHANQDYTLADTNVWGILDAPYQTLQQAAWAVMRDEEQQVGADVPIEEQTPRDYERMVARLESLLGPYVESHRDMTPYVRANLKEGAPC